MKDLVPHIVFMLGNSLDLLLNCAFNSLEFTKHFFLGLHGIQQFFAPWHTGIGE